MRYDYNQYNGSLILSFLSSPRTCAFPSTLLSVYSSRAIFNETIMNTYTAESKHDYYSFFIAAKKLLRNSQWQLRRPCTGPKTMYSVAVAAADGRRTSRKPCGIPCAIINRNRKTVIKPNQMQSKKRTRETHPWGVLSYLSYTTTSRRRSSAVLLHQVYTARDGDLYTLNATRTRAR